jgi:hypothetical protein
VPHVAEQDGALKTVFEPPFQAPSGSDNYCLDSPARVGPPQRASQTANLTSSRSDRRTAHRAFGRSYVQPARRSALSVSAAARSQAGIEAA